MVRAVRGANDLVERVRHAVTGVVEREGYELVEVEIVREHGRMIVRLYIDTIPASTKERGVTVEDCSHVSRIVSDLLEVEDLIGGAYFLEVSSPGLFKPLTRPEHFDRAIGERIKVKTYEKIDGRRVFTGTLRSCEEGILHVEVDGRACRIDLANVLKANLEPIL